MTEVFEIGDTELEAIRSVERYVATSIPRRLLRDTNSPDDDLATVNRMLSRLAPAPPVEEVASRPNGENPLNAEPYEDEVNRLQWEVFFNLLTLAPVPEELKTFTKAAVKIENVDLIAIARDALKRYMGKQDEIPF